MRRFVIIGHNVDPSGDFTLNDLCGGAGRLDVLLRCVSSAFFVSHGIRKDVEVYLVLPGRHGSPSLDERRSGGGSGAPVGPKTVRFSGRELRYLNPDERSTGALVRTALLKNLEGDKEIVSTPGVYVSRRSLESLARALPGPVWLVEDGEPWPRGGLPGDVTFYLSDHLDFTKEEENLLQSAGARRVSLGPTSLHSHQCITIVHWLLDGGIRGGGAPDD
ncbi:MAG: tRNA (pseudouridine(54)-N(1))-methyltransferase TrmY [Thermoplasmata archaeon]